MSLYGLIIGIAIAIGIQYFTHQNHLIPKSKEIWFIFFGLSFSILGARAYHVIDQWAYYSLHPDLILTTWNGGLGIYGAILAGLVYLFLYSIKNQIPYIKILDSITPILPLCQSIGRFANFVNQEIPIWWLESGLSLLLFLFIKRFPQNPTAKYLIGYGIIRFINEFFRTDTWMISQIKIAQVISIIFIIIGLKLLHAHQANKTS